MERCRWWPPISLRVPSSSMEATISGCGVLTVLPPAAAGMQYQIRMVAVHRIAIEASIIQNRLSIGLAYCWIVDLCGIAY